MSQPIVIFLLVLAFLLPVLGAALLRVVGPRLAQRQVLTAATLLVAVPIVSAVMLARASIPSLQIAGVTVLLADQPVVDGSLPADLPVTVGGATAVPSAVANTPLAAPTSEPAATNVPASTTVLSPEATLPATATPEPPTATPEPPTATPEPPTATAEPPKATAAPPKATAAPAPARRTYKVKPGDTLRGIAAKFNVSVQAILDANKLTPAQADALKIDQELIIP